MFSFPFGNGVSAHGASDPCGKWNDNAVGEFFAQVEVAAQQVNNHGRPLPGRRSIQMSGTLPMGTVKQSWNGIFAVVVLLATHGAALAGEPEAIAVDSGSFKCLAEMEKVRHFYVDNLQGDLDATMEVAQRGQGAYPPGSVVQLVPGEAMVKHPKGFNAATNDWEFFELDVSPDGTSIRKRGFADVVNRFGGNCFACHIKARPEFDLICEDDHGCDPIPITRPMLAALQKTDARCSEPEPLTEVDTKALEELNRVMQAMTQAASQASQ